MAIKLETPAEQVDVSAAEYATMLSNLQANILKPHGRDFARHIFLQFTGNPAEVRRWIRERLAPLVSTAKQQFDGSARRKAAASDTKPDGGTVCGFFLSAKGYEFLGFRTSGFASDTFRKGMKDQGTNIVKRLTDVDNEDARVQSWQPCFQGEIHALVTLADDTLSTLEGKSQELRQSAAGVARVLGIEEGNVLRRKGEPVEHFGYLDGISQPLFTKQDIAALDPKPRAWDPSARLSLVLVDDPLSNEPDAFGSYLAYRKLGQDVPRFADSVHRLAQSLAISPDLAGAYVVGRFKNGTPVELAKEAGPGTKGNDFNYDDDGHGARCPFHAHIRKANPRGTTPLTSLGSEKKRRIARRGIPYGPPIDAATADNLPANADPTAARGLLFMCFQSNIEEQFEFIQRVWVDNKHFPTSVLTNGLLQRDTGDDPLIGQDRDEAQRWPKQWGKHDKGNKTINFESAIKLEGGEYFFAPSLPFLKAL